MQQGGMCMNDFQKYLKDFMAENNMNQKETAERLNIGQSQISMYVSGRVEPSLRTQKRMKAILDSSIVKNPTDEELDKTYPGFSLTLKILELCQEEIDLESLETVVCNESTKKLLINYIKKLSEVV